MGVDPTWVRFPNCAEMSRFVPVCPLLSIPFWGPEWGQIGTKENKQGQNGTFRDNLGNARISNSPPFSSSPKMRDFPHNQKSLASGDFLGDIYIKENGPHS